jgi:hypothetical protein
MNLGEPMYLMKPHTNSRDLAAFYGSESSGGDNSGGTTTGSGNGPFISLINGHSYLRVNANGISWDQARLAARALGAGWGLATITSAAEQDVINRAFAAFSGEFWLGASQPIKETRPDANWSWVTGENWSYENWTRGEPNDFGGPADEQYLAMYSDGGRWNDDSGLGEQGGFMAELTGDAAAAPPPNTEAMNAFIGSLDLP